MFLNIPQGAPGVRGVPGLFLHPAGPARPLLSERSRHLREMQGESRGEELLTLTTEEATSYPLMYEENPRAQYDIC